uniref:Pleckstrin homology domain containing, family O member 1b n=1 Tax=Tetraodon nigroviridis TaxID=99883 RepID=H3CB89_TETNG
TMKKNQSGKRGPAEPGPAPLQPDKVGWIRRFCGRGFFREIWKNRFVVLWREQLFICEKEVKEPGGGGELLDLSDYERCEEIRKNRSRSKKNPQQDSAAHSSHRGRIREVPNLVFLAVSPEEKESWISALNGAITRAKNRILDEVTVDDSQLCHLTRDRVKIPHSRRRPTRGHLLTAASGPASDGTLTLDLVQEEDGCDAFRVSVEKPASRPSPVGAVCSGRSQSLPREAAASWETGPGKHLAAAVRNRCASVDLILTHPEDQPPGSPSPVATPIHRLQELIRQKLEATERLLTEARAQKEAGPAEAERLLTEALAAWQQAQEVLVEVQELRELQQQLLPTLGDARGTAAVPKTDQNQRSCA